MGEPDGFGLYSLKGSGTNGFADLRPPDRRGRGALPLKRTRAALVAVPAIGLIALALWSCSLLSAGGPLTALP